MTPVTRPWWSRHWRQIAAIGTAAVIGAAGTAFVLSGRDTPEPVHITPPHTTPVVRQDLVDAITVPGEVTHGPPVPLASRTPGTLTWLPAVDTVVDRGGVLFRTDERPVLLLIGLVPMYRPIGLDAKGQDVHQLEENLHALGYSGFTVDDTFGSATATAVRQWQHDENLAVTGTVDVTDVIFAPTTVRVDSLPVRLGASSTGDVLEVTGVEKMVNVQLSTAGNWAHPGTKVSVSGAGKSVEGVVRQADADQDGTTTAATITVADQSVLTGDSVTVRYVVRQRTNVLTVPVAALLAIEDGGYGLQLEDGRIIEVQVGMFADGRVEVSGPEVNEGLVVGLPS